MTDLATLAAHPVPTLVVDRATLAILGANEAAAEEYGWGADELATRTLLDLHPPEDLARVRGDVQRAFAGDPVPQRWWHRRADGSLRYVEVTGRDTTWAGRAARILAVHDLTERQALDVARQLEAARLAGVIALQQAVATTDLESSALMELITDRARRLAGAAAAILVLFEEADAVITASSGSVGLEPGARLDRGALPFESVLQVPNTEADTRGGAVAVALGARALAAVPVWESGRPRGLLAVGSPLPHAFGDGDVRTLQLLAGLLGSSLSRAAAELARQRTAAALRESEDRHRTALLALHDAVAVFHADGRAQAMNPAAARLLGIGDAEIGDALVRRWRATADDGTPLPDADFPPLVALLAGRPVRDMVLGLRGADGDVTWVLASAEPLWRAPEVLPYAVVASFTDITAIRRAEEALRAARDTAESASRAKSHFLASMSHELRTPLNSVIGFASVLKRSAAALGDAEQRYVERIHENGRHLLALIDEILDLSKIEAGRLELHPEPVDLARFVPEVLEQFGPVQHDGQLRLRAEVPGGLQPLVTDPARLRQVLVNLLGNAVKFTERGEVTVRVLAGDLGVPRALEVEDTGIGIPADRLDAVFEPFQQADGSTARRFGGTGLGLAISRSLLLRMGHAIAVRSEEGRGTRFTITFGRQAARAPTAPVPAPAPAAEAAPGPLVSVVGASPDARIVLRALLEELGYRVEVATGLPDAATLAGAVLVVADLTDRGDVAARLSLLEAAGAAGKPAMALVDAASPPLPRGALPLEPPLTRQAVATALDALLGRPPRDILVVDDDPDARTLMELALQEAGYRTRTARDGQEALLELERRRPDAIVLDLRMRRMGGATFLEIVADDPALRDLPVVVVTAEKVTDELARRLAGRPRALVQKGGTFLESLVRELRAALA